MGDREIHRNAEGEYCGTWDDREIRATSVTTAIGFLNDFSMIPAHVLENAAAFGTAVHKTIELYEKNQLKSETLDPALEPILEAWKCCKEKHRIIVHKTEVKVFSKKYNYAGCLDMIATVKKHGDAVIEIKTRKYNPVTDKLQSYGYLQAYNESYPNEKVCRRYFCGLYLTGKYDFFEIKKEHGEPDHLSILLSALALKKWGGLCKQ